MSQAALNQQPAQIDHWQRFKQAIEHALGTPAPSLPTPQNELWHFTNLRALTAFDQVVKLDQQEQKNPVDTAINTANMASPRLVFIDNQWQPELSDLTGLHSVEIAIDDAPAWPTGRENAPQASFTVDMAAAIAPKCINLHFPDGYTLDKPLWLYHGVSNGSSAPQALGLSSMRLKLSLGKGGRLTLIEQIMGARKDSAGWLCDSFLIDIAEQAELSHFICADNTADVLITRHDAVRVADMATYRRDTLLANSALARFEADINAHNTSVCKVNTLQLTSVTPTLDSQLHDTTVRIYHNHENTRSEVTQRNIVGGANLNEQNVGGLAVFQGKFYVEPIAQKTDAYMRCENLLLHDAARTHHKPELEIYADDVKCSHGASTGGMNEDQFFYLKTRGLTDTAARALLVQGFAMAGLTAWPEAMHTALMAKVSTWLNSN